MICPYCQSAKIRNHGFYNNQQRYKCDDCFRKFTESTIPRPKPQPRHPHPCTVCGEETKNPKFCSSHCAATQNNKLFPKRQSAFKDVIGSCKRCGVEVRGKRKICNSCYKMDWSLLTLKQIKHEARYQIHAVVRGNARTVYRASKRPKYCINCGYDKHYEVCHIRAINDFPLDTTVTTVNDLHNLIALCRNCHWELDHNLVSIEEIRAKNEADF